jgi:hypothetical protein
MHSGREQPATEMPPSAARAIGEVHPATDPEAGSAVLLQVRQGREPFGRFRRGLDRMRIDGDAAKPGEEDEAELRLELTLLREENARLKASHHRPSDVGTLIEQLRLVAGNGGEAEALDEAWSLLTECLVIREGLERACTEIQAAIGSVQQRLRTLSVDVGEVSAGTAAQLDAVATYSAAS